MRVLLIGGGGREHALAWAIRRSPLCDALFLAPGNAGTAALAPSLPLDVRDGPAVLQACREHRVDLVVIGPEQPLVAGLADVLRAGGVAVFGPGAAAARLEGSKSYAKAFMARHGIPTARSEVFAPDDTLLRHLELCPIPVVVKADGLASGKGVLVCTTRAEALAAGEAMVAERRFGAAGERVLVEEFMAGEEASVLALVEGEEVVILPPLQDHKRRFAGDQGPNTGGMGAYTPVPAVTEALLERVRVEVLLPAARGLIADGTPYRGLLYAGLMLSPLGPRVVEFNCRFGDPECEPLVLALESDLLPLLDATARGRLREAAPLRVRPGAVCCVVMVDEGYPDAVRPGRVLGALPLDSDDAVVFHAGTRRDSEGQLVSTGGRVLAVTARGVDHATARARAYAVIASIHAPGLDVRDDIAARALASRAPAFAHPVPGVQP